MTSKRQIFKSALIGLLVLTLLNFPFLSISNRAALLGSIPVHYLYIFGIWLLGIALLYLTAGRSNKRNKNHPDE